MSYHLPDSGKREKFESGAVRDVQEDKPRYDLIPPGPLYRLAMHYTNGAKKYGERNYEKGMPTSRIIASLMRHVEAFRLGDKSEDHLAAVAWNAFALMFYEGTKWDDLGEIRATISALSANLAMSANKQVAEDLADTRGAC
jgi:hypothetical protein